jgi:hypothetical protein
VFWQICPLIWVCVHDSFRNGLASVMHELEEKIMMIGNAKIQLNHLSLSLSLSSLMCLSICLYILQLCSLSVCSVLSINICNHTYHTHIYLRSSEPTHHLPLAHSHTIFDAQCVWFLNVWVCVLFKSVCVCARYIRTCFHTHETQDVIWVLSFFISIFELKKLRRQRQPTFYYGVIANTFCLILFQRVCN